MPAYHLPYRYLVNSVIKIGDFLFPKAWSTASNPTFLFGRKGETVKCGSFLKNILVNVDMKTNFNCTENLQYSLLKFEPTPLYISIHCAT